MVCWNGERFYSRHQYEVEEYPTDYEGDGGPITGDMCQRCGKWKGQEKWNRRRRVTDG